MKTKMVQIFVLAAMVSGLAHAVVRPGWERPVQKASLIEIDGAGHEVGVGLKKSLTENRRDGAKAATSFTFFEEKLVMCVVAPCPPIPSTTLFDVVSITKDGCGSTIYNAYERTNQVNTRVGRHMQVQDHRFRLCDDYKKYMWDVTITGGHRSAVRFLHGTPEPVYTIQ